MEIDVRLEKYKKNLKPNVTCLLHVAIVYCAIAIGDMIESHFSHSKQWMVGVQFPTHGKRH